MSSDTSDNSYIALWNEIKKYFHLQVEYTKFTFSEKLTIIFSAIAVIAIILVIGGLALFYLSSAFVHILESWFGSIIAANLIICGVLILILGAIIALRKRLILDPIARFISKLFLDPNK